MNEVLQDIDEWFARDSRGWEEFPAAAALKAAQSFAKNGSPSGVRFEECTHYGPHGSSYIIEEHVDDRVRLFTAYENGRCRLSLFRGGERVGAAEVWDA